MGSFKTTTRNQFDPLTEKIISGLYDYGTELYEKGPTQFTGDLTQGMSDLGKNVLEQYSALSFGQPEYTQSMDVYKGMSFPEPRGMSIEAWCLLSWTGCMTNGFLPKLIIIRRA